jgi:hypothetical protein
VAHAAPTLRFVLDGVTQPEWTCADGAACDLDSQAGVVLFSGAVEDFTINVSTGISYPVLTGVPLMDLISFDIQSMGGGHTLQVMLSDDSFSAGGWFSAKFGGTLTGDGATVQAEAYYDTDNVLFATATGTLIGTMGPFGPGPFAGKLGGEVAPSGPYSVTQVITLTTTGATRQFPTVFSGDFEISVPEPTTVALMGIALGLFGFAMRKPQQLK